MREAGLSVAQQRGITVSYNGIVGGDCVADGVFEETVVVELKASGRHLCLLPNFGRPQGEALGGQDNRVNICPPVRTVSP